MPVVPQPDSNGIVRDFGFAFNFSNAFASTATAQGFTTNSNFAAIEASLGSNTDTYPTQATAWGRANQAYSAASGGNLPQGFLPGQGVVYNGTGWELMSDRVKIANYAGESNQGSFSIAIGRESGRSNQGSVATAIGFLAGNDSQSGNAIAIGSHAGETSQGVNAVAIGTNAGTLYQHQNSIVINATGAMLNSSQQDSLTISPIRQLNGNAGVLTYDSNTSEVNVDTTIVSSLGTSIDTPSLSTTVWAYAKQAETDSQTAISTAQAALSNITPPFPYNSNGTFVDVNNYGDFLVSATTTGYINFQTRGTTPGDIQFLCGNYMSMSLENSNNRVLLKTTLNAPDAVVQLSSYDSKLVLGNAGTTPVGDGLFVNPTTLAFNGLNIGTTLGSSIDTPSLSGSVWAYAKQAEADALAALDNNIFGTIFVDTIYSQDGDNVIQIPDTGGGTGFLIGTRSNAITIGGGTNIGISTGGLSNDGILSLSTKFLEIAVDSTFGITGEVLTSIGNDKCSWVAIPGNVGVSTDTPSLSGSLWAYSKQAESDAQAANTWITNATTPNSPGELGIYTDTTDSLWGGFNSLSSSFNSQYVPNTVGAVGTLNDTPSLITSLWAYSKQAEIDAQNGIATAQAADATATTAQGNADSAQTTANTALTNAATAQTTANTALIPNTSLQAAIRIIPFVPAAQTNNTWSSASTANEYVPLAASSANTCLAPIAPSDSVNGWRFTKTYLVIVPATSGLTLNATYTILVVGNTNWTAIGAAAATVGTQFKYNGAAITGNTTGTCQSSTKMSWYVRNMLYGVGLPSYVLTYSYISKAQLQNAWFLVRFDADMAQQGVLAIQIETYAFKNPGNTSNEYTGRWAYSFPNAQSSGFTATNTTNITTNLTVPRLKAGFTYLLYASDDYPSTCPTTYTGVRQYLPYGAGLFPSQTDTTQVLRNPYDIYPTYAHLPMSGCQYTANALQPSYGSTGLYQDEAQVEVAAIYLNTSSTSPSSGVGQTVQDFTVLDWGYSIGESPSNVYSIQQSLRWS